MKKIVIILVPLVLCLVLICSACQGKTNSEAPTDTLDTNTRTIEGTIIFDGSNFVQSLVYPSELTTNLSLQRNKLTAKFRSLLEKMISSEKDSVTESNSERAEILLGQTNRSDSALPKLSTDSVWYKVEVVGKKIVINGSTDYMLEYAVDIFLNALQMTDDGIVYLPSDFSATEVYTSYKSEPWFLEAVPTFESMSERVSSNLYNGGTTLSHYSQVSTTYDSLMQSVNRCTLQETESYAAKLKKCGYSETSRRDVDGNLFITMENVNRVVHINWFPELKITRVIVDPISIVPQTYSYVTENVNEGAVFYQYGLNMDPGGYDTSKDENTSGYDNNGLLLVIKCADNSVVIVDGGSPLQMRGKNDDYAPAAELNSFLHSITGTPQNEKVRISCWYITHFHGDHIMGFYTFLQRYYSLYSLERVCLNPMKNNDALFSDDDKQFVTNQLSTLLNQKYPNHVEFKPHTGDVFKISDVTFEVLYTQEDGVSAATGQTKISAANDTSLVIKATAGNMSMLILGDTQDVASEALVSTYTSALRCDIVQVAHHCINNLPDLYAKIQAPIAFVNQTQTACETHRVISKAFKSAKPYSSTFYYCGNPSLTVGLQMRNNRIVKVYP